MSENNAAGSSDNGTNSNEATKTVSVEDFEKQRNRGDRLEGLTRDLEKKLKDAEAVAKSIDLEEYKTLKADKEKLQEELAKNNPEEREKLYSAREAKIRKELSDAKAEVEQKLEAVMKENKTLKVTDKVMAEIGALFHPTCHRFIKQEVERLCDFVDGAIVIKDEAGVPQYSKANAGQQMSIKEFGEELAKQFPPMAVATATGGGRSSNGKANTNGAANGGGASTLPNGFSAMSQDQQKEWFSKNPEALKNFMGTFNFNS